MEKRNGFAAIMEKYEESTLMKTSHLNGKGKERLQQLFYENLEFFSALYKANRIKFVTTK